MLVTINIKDEKTGKRLMDVLDKFKDDGMEVSILDISNKKENSIDFSSIKIDSFKNIDGMEYQKQLRDEW